MNDHLLSWYFFEIQLEKSYSSLTTSHHDADWQSSSVSTGINSAFTTLKPAAHLPSSHCLRGTVGLAMAWSDPAAPRPLAFGATLRRPAYFALEKYLLNCCNRANELDFLCALILFFFLLDQRFWPLGDVSTFFFRCLQHFGECSNKMTSKKNPPKGSHRDTLTPYFVCCTGNEEARTLVSKPLTWLLWTWGNTLRITHCHDPGHEGNTWILMPWNKLTHVWFFTT